ncbi:DUF6795 domain-containing protein [Colwellia sp. 20A7]|uniref:DUF6795 domain-containing protein n=1 Tax=Colwellia sp. 20A7 TaxID=2689569 RepID=UPI00135AAEE6|nr:DUF6795 domain-containing protein [Colwellia sp. 20A7]
MLKDQSYRKLLSPISLFILCLTLIALFIYSMESQAMFGFFKRHTVEMSPEVRGRITDGGKPIVGMQVARSLSYEGYEKGKEQLEHTFTNENGEFSFKPMIIKSRMPGDLFGQNMLVKQSVYVERGEDLYSLWFTRKPWDPIQPMSDLLLQLNADLQNKEVQHQIDTTDFGGMPSQGVISICYWQSELISTYYNNELITSYAEVN